MTMTEEKTRDDILNEEIEAEHAEAERRNNTAVEYEIASDEESKMFEENMKVSMAMKNILYFSKHSH